MSYDIFFVRRDPGQSFEDALDELEASYEGGDSGPLTEVDLEVWEAVLPKACEVLGPQAEVTPDGAETREVVDPTTGLGLTFFQGEFEIHLPAQGAGADDLIVMDTVYRLARAVEAATGLEGYDPQLGEPVSASSDTSPTRRRWADDPDLHDDDDDGGAVGNRRSMPPPSLRRSWESERDPFDPEAAPGPRATRRWWEFWKA